MDDATRDAIEGLRKLKVNQLKDRYRELFGEESPSSNRQHLFRRVAWRLQARAEGMLSERARQRAVEIADDAHLRLRAPANFWGVLERGGSRTTASKRDPRLPAPGALLKRSYGQQSVEVRVYEDRFEYNGKSYASLSAIALQVTGTRWNGFLFFGLNKANQHD
jgi:hypothetical protein